MGALQRSRAASWAEHACRGKVLSLRRRIANSKLSQADHEPRFRHRLEISTSVQRFQVAKSDRIAVVLLSGGLDSTTVLAIAKKQGFDCHAISFRYGQRHAVELERAKDVALRLGVSSHVIVDFDLRQFGGSALTGDIDVPKERSAGDMAKGIPVTYVPARNTIFLSFALAQAETLGASDVFIGVNALDYSGYPDCRPEYIDAYERMSNLATKAGVEGRQHLKIHAPLIELSKAQIIRTGLELGVDYSMTSSCYDPGPDGKPCTTCDSCQLRAKGFGAAAVADPLLAKFGMA